MHLTGNNCETSYDGNSESWDYPMDDSEAHLGSLVEARRLKERNKD